MADRYEESARKSGFVVHRLNLRELKFDVNLHHGYQEIQALEPDLVSAQKAIKACQHLVLIYPLWWGSMPALLKGFLDRAWLPGFAFKYHENDPFWDRLLAGRSARVVVTSDAPYLYNMLAYGGAPYQIIKKTILKFCGFKPVRLTAIGGVKNLSPQAREKALAKIARIGNQGR